MTLRTMEERRGYTSGRLNKYFGGSQGVVPSRIASGESYADIVLSDSPKGFWKCQDASGLLQDSSGNANHMTSQTGTTVTYQQTGPFGSDYCVNLAQYNFSAGQISAVINNFTYECWLNTTTGSGVIVGITNRPAAGGGASLGHEMLYQGSTIIIGDAPNVSVGSNSSTFGTGVWLHVVVCRDAGTWKYYINGSLNVANAGTFTPNTPSACSTRIGTSATQSMKIAYVAFYETALSQTQVTNHYNCQVP